MKRVLLGLSGVLLALPVMADAAVFQEGENVVFDNNVTSDLFVGGEAVEIQKDISVDGDAFVAGDMLNIAGSIQQDIYAGGYDVTISGTVGDDVHAAGYTVTISSPSVDDLFAAGRSVRISEGTTVRGDAYLAGASIVLEGKIEGDVLAAGERIRISDSAVIYGNLTTYGEQHPDIAGQATIVGTTSHITTGPSGAGHSFQLKLLGWISSVVTFFVTGLALLWLLPRFSQNTRAIFLQKPAQAFGLGVLWLLLMLPVSIVLLISVIGWHLALIVLSLTVVALLLAGALISLVVGPWVLDKMFHTTSDKITWQHILVGAVVVNGLQLIPIIGWLINCLIIIATFGALLMHLWHVSRDDENFTNPG